jgi:hypothetical protein
MDKAMKGMEDSPAVKRGRLVNGPFKNPPFVGAGVTRLKFVPLSKEKSETRYLVFCHLDGLLDHFLPFRCFSRLADHSKHTGEESLC